LDFSDCSFLTCRKSFQAYLDKDSTFFNSWMTTISLDIHIRSRVIADYINYAVYQFGEHKCIYDYEKLTRLLSEIGFTSVTKISISEGTRRGEPHDASANHDKSCMLFSCFSVKEYARRTRFRHVEFLQKC